MRIDLIDDVQDAIEVFTVRLREAIDRAKRADYLSSYDRDEITEALGQAIRTAKEYTDDVLAILDDPKDTDSFNDTD